MPFRLLILGGTTEANALARALVGRDDVAPVLSLAGRTEAPHLPPIPHRIGGFGGADGLARYLDEAAIRAVVDATHPFAPRISANAAAACATLALPLAVLTRPAWRAEAGDRWMRVENLDAAATALGPAPRRVFLTVGRQGLAAFRQAPQHDYLIRTVDPPAPADLPPRNRVIRARGPFPADEETELIRREGVDVLVTKNSGGAAGKLAACRTLGLPVVMVERPAPAGGRVFAALPDVLAWLDTHRGAP